MKLVDEFKEFAIKGNVMDMGVGIVIGAAFTSVVNSLVKDILSPFFSLMISGIDSSGWFLVLKHGTQGGDYATVTDALADKAIILNLGSFINAAISFLIVSVVLFSVIKGVNRLRRPEKVTADPIRTRECSHCYSIISLKATRCPYCTSELDEEN